MNQNKPQEESEHSSPKQGTCKDRIEDQLERIEDQLERIKDQLHLPRQDISDDGLSAYQLAQLQVKYLDLYARLLALLLKVKDD